MHEEDIASERPKGSNADEWQLFLTEYPIAYVAVQISEAIEQAARTAKDRCRERYERELAERTRLAGYQRIALEDCRQRAQQIEARNSTPMDLGRGVTAGVCIAAAWLVRDHNEDELARQLLDSHGIDRSAAEACRLDAHDMDPLRPVFDDIDAKKRHTT
ncbi:hypothetical protein [Fodinicurvata sediminis]|uniref:hypothetical protein n=1 Tax=Fodinicurvata sediminis TaxID=1121832 RepID=UPI00041EF3C3|nr:hypothetical protein [Fodinicurvata sediminis]